MDVLQPHVFLDDATCQRAPGDGMLVAKTAAASLGGCGMAVGQEFHVILDGVNRDRPSLQVNAIGGPAPHRFFYVPACHLAHRVSVVPRYWDQEADELADVRLLILVEGSIRHMRVWLTSNWTNLSIFPFGKIGKHPPSNRWEIPFH